MSKSLTAEQKKLFEEYMNAQRELNILTDCETFIYALKLEAKHIRTLWVDFFM